jgi:YidC/Oxa1 family membrane protein insertase
MFNTLLVNPIFNLLAVIYAGVHDFGLAIILLTIIVRGVLWPLVTKQLHSQRALQELGYSDAVMEKIFHQNAERVLGL